MLIFKRCSTHGLVGRDVTYNDDVIQTRELVQRALSKRSDCSEHSDNTDIGTCFECCQGDYCNKEGCGTTGLFLKYYVLDWSSGIMICVLFTLENIAPLMR